MIEKNKYDQHIKLQISKAQRTVGRTIRFKYRREWIYNKMQELKITGKSILCVGARHYSEVEFFEKRGFKSEGIDLFEADQIIKCNMSKMLEHPYIKNQKYDIVFCNEVMEHCVDLNGFIKGLNKICKKYFICMGPSSQEKEKIIRYSWWDPAVHQFMIDSQDIGIYSKNLLETFKDFKIIVNESHKNGHRVFFILKKK